MEPIPKLNRARWRLLRPLLVALAVAAGVGSVRQRLAAIYVEPPVGAKGPATADREPRREDAKLFARATALGLLRLEADGRIAVAPADLPLRRAYARAYPDLLVPRADGPDWLAGPWNNEARRLHQALHFSAAGRYVRQQVEAFNARQLLAAIRWRAGAGLTGSWTADWAGAPLALTAALPLPNQAFLAEIAGDWPPWQWVARWPALENRPSVRFRLRPQPPPRPGERLELLVVGDAPALTGATTLASEPQCRERAFCPESEAVAHRLTVAWREGFGELTVSCRPVSASRIPELWRQEITQIRREGGRLLWREPVEPGAGSVAWPPAAGQKLSRFDADERWARSGREAGAGRVARRAAPAVLEGRQTALSLRAPRP